MSTSSILLTRHSVFEYRSQASIQSEPLLTHQRNAIQMPFRLWKRKGI